MNSINHIESYQFIINYKQFRQIRIIEFYSFLFESP